MNRTNQPCGLRYPLWLWPNLLGLDSPIVAVAWQWLFIRSFDIRLPWVFHLILGLSVWCIYLADRLHDAKHFTDTGTATKRLCFTKRHFTTLCAVAATAGLVNLYLIIRHVPRQLMFTGLITASLLGIYYLLRVKGGTKIASVIPREIVCGMIFALGTIIAPMAFSTDDQRFQIPMILFGILCSANCVLISIWEKEEDLANRDHSIATHGSRVIPYLGIAIGSLAAILFTLSFFEPRQLHASIALSATALRIMFHFDNRIPPDALRALADGVLLTPLLFAFA